MIARGFEQTLNMVASGYNPVEEKKKVLSGAKQ
jgi:hypothetical protein